MSSMNFFILYWVLPDPPAAENQVLAGGGWLVIGAWPSWSPNSWACRIGGSSGILKSFPYFISFGTLWRDDCSGILSAPLEEAAREFCMTLAYCVWFSIGFDAKVVMTSAPPLTKEFSGSGFCCVSLSFWKIWWLVILDCSFEAGAGL